MLDKIRPVSYKWNGLWGQRNDDTVQIGLIGQEVEHAAPYILHKISGKLQAEGEKTDIITLDHEPLIVILVNAVHDLEARLKAARERLGLG